MDIESIQHLLKSNVPDSDVTVTGDGHHFEAYVISPVFEGMSLIQRQRMINAIVGKHLLDGTIHALSVKAKTPFEWQREKK